MWLILMRKTLFDQNGIFFVYLRKITWKQPKRLVYLYVAHFAEKNTFDEKEMF